MIKKKKTTKSSTKSKGTGSADAKSVDFSGVQSGGRRKIPEGDYHFVVDKAYWDESEAGNDMVVFESVIKEGPQKGWRGYTHCAITPKALWKLRQMLEALGIEVPDGKLAINPKKYIGKEHGGSVEQEEYDGKKRSKITDIYPVDQLGGEEEEESDESEETEEEESEEEEEEESSDEEEEEEEEEED